MMCRVAFTLAVIILAHAEEDIGFEAGFSDFRTEWTQEPLAIKGTLPEWLVGGAHVMNGVSLWGFPKRRMRHNLDGYAKVHAVEFTSSTTAAFSGQFVRSGFYNESIKKNDVSAALLFEETVPPRFALPLQNAIAPNDNININVFRINSKLALVSDLLGTIYVNQTMGTDEICVDSKLNPFSKKSFVDVPAFPGGLDVTMGSAHPLTERLSADSDTGDYLGIVSATQAVSFQPVKSEYLRIFKAKVQTGWQRREEVITLPLPRAPYMHAFGLVTPQGAKAGSAANYSFAVLVHHPFYMDLTKEFPKYTTPMEEVFEFKTEEKARFYVVDLHDKKLSANLSFDGEPFLFSHVLNSFQVDGQIYIDLVGYRQIFFKRYSFDVLLNKTARDASAPSQTLRFKLDLATGSVTEQDLLPGADMELPTINEYFKGRQNCYAWGYENNFERPKNSTGATGFATMAATKFDLCESAKQEKTIRTSFYKPYTYFGEVFFVPRPGSIHEDDGVVLVPAIDGQSSHMSLLVLNAATMELLAEVPFPEGTGGYITHTRFLFDYAKGDTVEALFV